MLDLTLTLALALALTLTLTLVHMAHRVVLGVAWPRVQSAGDELLDHQFVVPILTQRLVRHHLHLHLHLLERPLRAAPVGVLLLEAVSFRVLAVLLRAGDDLPLYGTRRSKPVGGGEFLSRVRLLAVVRLEGVPGWDFKLGLG